jgi:hypothetical protein
VQVQQRVDEQVEILKRQHAERERAICQDTATEMAQLRRDLAEATAQLRAVEDYTAERERVEGQLVEAQQQCGKLQSALDKEVRLFLPSTFCLLAELADVRVMASRMWRVLGSWVW